MTREFMIKELVARGIKADATEVVKNGVVLKGITLGEGTVRPTIYEDWFKDVSESDVDFVIDKILDVMNTKKPQFDVNNLTDWNYVRNRLQLCIQKRSTEDIVKRDFLDLEQYVRIIVSDNDDELATCKVRPDLFNKYGITEAELFYAALECSRANVKVEDMTYLMAEMTGMSVEEIAKMQGDTPPMIVITNTKKTNGASGICYMDVLREIADRYEKDLAILPSSIHECIVYPVDGSVNFILFDNMVRDVNKTLLPEEVLSDHAYRYIRDEDRILY